MQSSTAWREIPISLIVSVLVLFLLNDFAFSGTTYSSRLDALIMMLLFCAFLFYVFKQMKQDTPAVVTEPSRSSIQIWGLILIGLAGLIIGGQLVVVNSVSISKPLGVSEKVIGLTVVAAGTSLPELVTSVVAATKRNSDIAIGNVIGSNIFNFLLILSLSTFIKPIAFNTKFNLDLYVLIGGTVFLWVAMLSGQRKKLDRWEAGVLLGFYLLYTTYLIIKA